MNKRKKYKFSKKEEIRLTYLVFLIFLTPAILYLAYVKYKEYKFEKNKKHVLVKIEGIMPVYSETESCTGNVNISYQFKNKWYYRCVDVPVRNEVPVDEYGIPVLYGDVYHAAIDSTSPDYVVVDFSNPAPETVQKKLKIASNILTSIKEYYPELSLCIVQKEYQKNGWKNIGSIYFYDTPFIENIDHNRGKLKKWLRSDSFQQIIKECELR
jgi:hypothetical protein